MSIQIWSEDIILVDLPRGLEDHDELQTAIPMAREKGTLQCRHRLFQCPCRGLDDSCQTAGIAAGAARFKA